MKHKKLAFVLVIVTVSISATIWNFSSDHFNIWQYAPYTRVNGSHRSVTVTGARMVHVHESAQDDLVSSRFEWSTTQESFTLKLNMSQMIYKVKDKPECMKVAADPKSFWRSQSLNGSLNTSDEDIARMVIAFRCGMLYPDFLSTPPTSKLYPFEQFYLSEPSLDNIKDTSNEKESAVTIYNSSSSFKVGETVAFKIEMRDGRGQPRLKGGDQIRVWFEDKVNDIQMAAKVTDLNNGTYMASAPLPWAGQLRLHVALAYSREYLRSVLYLHQVMKTFRPIAAVYRNSSVSEATPCYHTQVVPGFDSSELCNLTEVNGAPWFCGHPTKHELSCLDYKGSSVIGATKNCHVTDGEMEILNRSCRQPWIKNIPSNFELTVLPGQGKFKLPCHKVSPKSTWEQEVPTGYISRKTWYHLSCLILKPDYSKCFRNKQIFIFGDSNARFHYHQIQKSSKCTEIKKALTQKWHKPLLCAHKENNFTVSWHPHTNPFMHGHDLATLDSLIPTANAIDEIPSKGEYLIILNHYFHLTTSHISAIDYMLRYIKNALVRLFKRNPNIQVILQGPHIAWYGWADHYAAGDMLGTAIMDLQKEIFADINDKVVFFSPWDMTIAHANLDFHPSCNVLIYNAIVGFMCGR